MDIYDKEFASTVVWTNKPIWTMENTKVDRASNNKRQQWDYRYSQ